MDVQFVIIEKRVTAFDSVVYFYFLRYFSNMFVASYHLYIQSGRVVINNFHVKHCRVAFGSVRVIWRRAFLRVRFHLSIRVVVPPVSTGMRTRLTFLS